MTDTATLTVYDLGVRSVTTCTEDTATTAAAGVLEWSTRRSLRVTLSPNLVPSLLDYRHGEPKSFAPHVLLITDRYASPTADEPADGFYHERTVTVAGRWVSPRGHITPSKSLPAEVNYRQGIYGRDSISGDAPGWLQSMVTALAGPLSTANTTPDPEGFPLPVGVDNLSSTR